MISLNLKLEKKIFNANSNDLLELFPPLERNKIVQ